ncbi:hypothetical protein KCP78_24710 [Salmonella enterica subsp. enterica]|nr:hypothetical protein KCP78_24710 [Salmonella enterica subsp. enterica]
MPLLSCVAILSYFALRYYFSWDWRVNYAAFAAFPLPDPLHPAGDRRAHFLQDQVAPFNVNTSRSRTSCSRCAVVASSMVRRRPPSPPLNDANEQAEWQLPEPQIVTDHRAGAQRRCSYRSFTLPRGLSLC